jgi:hypothetical protein
MRTLSRTRSPELGARSTTETPLQLDTTEENVPPLASILPVVPLDALPVLEVAALCETQAAAMASTDACLARVAAPPLPICHRIKTGPWSCVVQRKKIADWTCSS